MPSDVRGQGSLIGNKLGGYQVEALVGRGAMGAVYLARDTKLNRHVALKVLLGSLARTPSIVRQFHQEAQSAAPLNHPNIVRIYSAGIESGTPFIAMEFVDGEPLDRFLKRKGKVTWDVALHVGAQVALALDCAHQHGIVHRDVKPSNILVDRKGGVRLTDFGIARMQSRDGRSGGPVVGTPQYMSPEQATGSEVFPASDLFSLGVTLYQMIAGDMPFKGESSMALIQSICEDDPPRLNKSDPSVPDDVARLVAYLMAKDPADRPASAKVAYGLIHRLQKHRGGASVVVESLTAFLKEEMEPRPFSSLERKEAQSRKKSSKVKRRLRKSKVNASLAAQAAAIALLAIAAFALGPFNAARGRERPAPPAEPIQLEDTQTKTPGMQRFAIFADGHGVDKLAWLGQEGVLVAQTHGLRGTLADGATGLLSIDVLGASVMSLSAPPRTSKSTSSAQAKLITTSLSIAADAPESSPLHGSIPVFAPGNEPDTAVLLSQQWGSATPRTQVLFAAPRAATENAAVALSPSGQHICAALFDEESGTHYLVEHEIESEDPASSVPRTLSRTGIFPESVQYTPDGARIAYTRRNTLGEVELWMLRSGATDLDGRRIVSGLAPGPLSFDSTTHFVALQTYSDINGAEVALLDLQTGLIIATYGPGTVAPQAWMPSGEEFIFAGPASDPQLMLASAVPPYTVRRGTSIPNGVGPAYAVARGSGQIAAADPNSDSPAVYIIEPAALARPAL
jgi:serine/threonine protein kinase